jgi:hypothetical protein
VVCLRNIFINTLHKGDKDDDDDDDTNNNQITTATYSTRVTILAYSENRSSEFFRNFDISYHTKRHKLEGFKSPTRLSELQVTHQVSFL